MLSDFDLSKQSGEPGGAPATIKQNGPNGVSCSLLPRCVVEGCQLIMVDNHGGYKIMHCGL